MDTLVLDEAPYIDDLLPFTATRQVVDIRIGILTLREKWERLLAPMGLTAGFAPSGFIPVFPRAGDPASDAALAQGGAVAVLPANLLPTRELVRQLSRLKAAGRLTAANVEQLPATRIQYPWHIFQYNAAALTEDFALLTEGRRSQVPGPDVHCTGEAIFIEEGARLSACWLNASTGPIYIGRDAEIMEGSLIRGPFAAGEGSVIKMGTKIYGATTIGPHCTAGGEIKNSVLFGFSNKGHDGYLGDSVIGEWCNLGAGTSNSNLKNNAGMIRVSLGGKDIEVGLKCGLLMGDYSRAAINTSFNTGTIAGVAANVFGQGLTPKYIPDFSWGFSPFLRYDWDRVLRDIGNWKKLKGRSLTDAEIKTLKHIFDNIKQID